jgi:hypothetical protein
MKKKQYDQELTMKQQELEQAKLQLQKEAEEKKADLLRDEKKLEIQNLQSWAKTLHGSGDQDALKEVQSRLMSLGQYVPGTPAPPQLTGEAANFQAIHGRMPTEDEYLNFKNPRQQERPMSLEQAVVDQHRDNPEMLQQLWEEKNRRDKKPTSLQEKIEATLSAYPGMDRDTATRIALGTKKVVTDPMTGNWASVDVGTNTQHQITEETPQAAAEPSAAEGEPSGDEAPKRDISLYEATERGTGLYSAFLNTASTISGMVRGPIATETVKDRQRLEMAQRNLFRALRESSKVLAFEMKTIFDEHPIDPSIWRSPEIAQANFEVIDETLKNRILDAEKAAVDKTLPISERRDARATLKAMKDFREILAVPDKQGDSGLSDDDRKLINKYVGGG